MWSVTMQIFWNRSAIESFCKSSVYAYLNEIKNGFLFANVPSNLKKEDDTIIEVTFDNDVEKIYEGYDPRSFSMDEANIVDNTLNVDTLK